MKPTRALPRFLHVLKHTAQRLKASSTIIIARRRFRLTSQGSLDDCADVQSLSSTLVGDALSIGSSSPGYLDELHVKFHQRVPASGMICSKYVAQISHLKLERDEDAILIILDHLLSAIPCPVPSPLFDLEDLFREIFRFACAFGNTLIQQQAMCLLLMQIRSGYTSFLVDVFCLQNDLHLRRLLLDLIKCLPDSWMEADRTDLHRAVQPIWNTDPLATTHRCAHAATPFVEFILQLVAFSQPIARAVLGAGFMDVIIRMCTTGFPDPRIPDADTSRWNATSSLITLCVSTLEHLSCYPDIRESMATKWHTLAECWPNSHSKALLNLTSMPEDFSRFEYRRAELSRRIQNMSYSISEDVNMLHQSCTELLYLSRRALHDTDIVEAAIEVLVSFICSPTRKHDVWMHLRREIMKTSYNVVTELLFDIVEWLLRNSNGLPIITRPLAYFLDFVDFVSDGSVFMRTVMEEAGIKTLGYESDRRVRAVPVVSTHSRRNSLQDLDHDLLATLLVL